MLVVSREKLEALAALAPRAEAKREPRRNGSGQPFDVDGFLSRNGIGVLRSGPWKDGTKYVLDGCPFTEHSTPGKAYVVQMASGAVAAGCQSSRCDWDWHALRARYEPQAGEQRERRGNGPTSEADDLGAGGSGRDRDERGSREEAEQSPKLRSYLDLAPTREQLAELAASPPIVPVATHLLYPRQTCVYAGQTGIGKTTSVVRAAVDLIYGREPWTGRPDGRDPLRVLIVSKDDSTLSLVRKVAALAPDDAWMDGRLAIIGKEKRALPLDDQGVEVLGNTIADGCFDVFVIDPYQHFLPAGLTVNDDEGARHTIEKLDLIAESLGVSGVLIHHPRKRAPKAKPATDLTKGERIEEIRGSAVLAQLARAVATLWEVEPGGRLLDAVVNDVPPLAELFFQTSAYGDRVVRWELAGPPSDAEAQRIRARLLELEPGTYSASALARLLFGIAEGKAPSGPRRTEAKRWARRIAEEVPERFAWRGDAGLEVCT